MLGNNLAIQWEYSLKEGVKGQLDEYFCLFN